MKILKFVNCKLNFSLKKFIISILAGWICCFISANTPIIDSTYDFTVLWGLFFPTLISIIWGSFYGFISCTIGGAMFAPQFALSIYGFGFVPSSLFILIVIISSGFFNYISINYFYLFYICHITQFIIILLYNLFNLTLSQLLATYNIHLLKYYFVYTFIPSNIVYANQISTIEILVIFIFAIRMLLSLEPISKIFNYKYTFCKYNSNIVLITIIFTFFICIFNYNNIFTNSGNIFYGFTYTSFQINIKNWQSILLKIATCIYTGDLLVDFLHYKTHLNNAEKESREQFKNIFEICDDMIWIIDGTTYELINYNKAFYNYFSKQFEKLNTTSSKIMFFDLIDTYGEKTMWQQYIYQTKLLNKFNADYIDAQKDTIFDICLFKIQNSINEYNISIFAKNITKERKLSLRTQLINKELEQKVLERTHDLQIAYENLERFSYIVSHDLKTPIRAIDAYNTIIIEDNISDLSEDSTEAVYGIQKLCSKALEMINGILQYSRSNTKTLQLEEIDTKEFILEFCKQNFNISESCKIKLIVSDLPNIKVDRLLFEQVIGNIISNALKFSSMRQTQTIFISYMENETDYAFYFKDNGIGFDMTYSDKIFQFFHRMHSEEEFEGTGIGLATVKNIISKHGGEVFIFSKPDKGCIVGFTLPKSTNS